MAKSEQESMERDYYNRLDGYWADCYKDGTFFDERPFKKSYKSSWAFTCINCDEKIIVPSNPKGRTYFVWNICMGYPFSAEKKTDLICSKNCADEAFHRLTEKQFKAGKLLR